MTENNVDHGEMLPIPQELLVESQKNVAIVMETGVMIDLDQQSKYL